MAIVACAMFAGLASAGTDRSEMLVKIHGIVPARGEDWSSASGVEMQARFWGDENVGAALAVGLDSWKAQSEYLEEEDQYSYTATSISGDMSAIPVGASLLFRNPLGKCTAAVFEAGLRYVFVDSDISVEAEYADAHGSTYTRDMIESDDGLVGLIGIGLEASMHDRILVRCGLDYQFDLMKPEERFLGEDLGETSLQALSINFGIGWAF